MHRQRVVKYSHERRQADNYRYAIETQRKLAAQKRAYDLQQSLYAFRQHQAATLDPSPRESQASIQPSPESLPSPPVTQPRPSSSRSNSSATKFTLDSAFSAISFHPWCPLCSDSQATIDILVKAIFVGWEGAMQGYRSDCVRTKVRQITDEQILVPLGLRSEDRFAILLMSALMDSYRHQARNAPTAIFPPWMKARPAQEMFKHSEKIDFLVWPLIRERLILKGSAPTEEFYLSYLKHVRLYWPGKVSSAFIFDNACGQWSLTDEFQSCFLDLNHWRMHDGFLEQYPDYADDVHSLNTLQAHILLWSMPPAGIALSDGADEGDDASECAPAGAGTRHGGSASRPGPVEAWYRREPPPS